MKHGFRWCPHCSAPHPLDERICPRTKAILDHALHVTGPRTSPLIGTILDGKYRILDLIGAGGMGEVFEAENLALRRIVAIKIVTRNAGDQGILRLEREAQIVASIHHPNLCDVHDVGRAPSGGPYLVFERLFGETLARAMQRTKRLGLGLVVDIFSQTLSGLHAAHERQVVHRDLKPQNLFLVERLGCAPLVKVLDFGLAQDLSPSALRITKPGNLCGTLQYMSPEQLQAQRLDPRSDLFTVGVMMYEALSGRHPFAAPNAITLQTNILEGNPPPLRGLRRDVPQALDAMIMRALSVTREHRPASALEMQHALLSVPLPRAAYPTLTDDAPSSSVSSVTKPLWLPTPSSPEA